MRIQCSSGGWVYRQPRFFRPWPLGGMPARLLASAEGTSRRCNTSLVRTPVTAQKGGFGVCSWASEGGAMPRPAQVATAAAKDAARVIIFPHYLPTAHKWRLMIATSSWHRQRESRGRNHDSIFGLAELWLAGIKRRCQPEDAAREP